MENTAPKNPELAEKAIKLFVSRLRNRESLKANESAYDRFVDIVRAGAEECYGGAPQSVIAAIAVKEALATSANASELIHTLESVNKIIDHLVTDLMADELMPQ